MGSKWLRWTLVILEGIAGIALFVFAGVLRFYVYPQQPSLGISLNVDFALGGVFVMMDALRRADRLNSAMER